MRNDLNSFYHEFMQSVYLRADADGRFAEDSFFETFCEELVEAGELQAADRAYYNTGRGVRVDGYGGDPAFDEGVLSLIAVDFNQKEGVETLTATEMEAAFRRLSAYLTKALDGDFRNSLEETSPGFGLASLIAGSWSLTHKVRLFLISNRILSNRVDGRPSGEVSGIPVTYSVWDIERLQRYLESGKAREDIVVDLNEHGGTLQALPAHLTDAGYEAYLMVIPGAELASIYEKWGARLLEQNVRVFLQARGNVNKGLKNTLDADPEMFFAYNNGITATAEEVVSHTSEGSLVITGLRNLQIVNGGQTTASIYAASQRKADLSKVFVQMKLSVIPPARAEEVVPKISEYANSQNKVNAADFFANHPYHIRLKQFSERVFVPSRDGAFRESKWFYERARGQYQDARSNLTDAARRKFDLEYPKNQVFTKTDLAKFLLVWEQVPEIVSRGAQKNFAHFATMIGKEWTLSQDAFNEGYYREVIAKAIVFRETEVIVSERSWYEGGYRANIVAYTIAKLAHDVTERGMGVDFERIWRDQALTGSLRRALAIAAEKVFKVIGSPPEGTVSNVTEWAKQQACWSRVAALTIQWPKVWLDELVSSEEQHDRERDAAKEQKVLNGIEAQSAVVRAGAQYWKEVLDWGIKNHQLSEKERGIFEDATKLSSKLPSEKQCKVIMKTLARLQSEGLTLELPAEPSD